MSRSVFRYLDAFFEAGYALIRGGSVDFPAEHVVNFQGPGVTIVDDPTNDQTIVTIANGNTTTTTTANFMQPAALATVTVAVTATASLAAGLAVYIAGGGYYQVSSITDGTHFVAENLGISGNAAPTTVINSGALVIPVGPANSLTIENSGTLLTVRSTLNFTGGLVAQDNSGSGRTDVFRASGAPSTGGSFTLSTNSPWGIITAGGSYTMPATPIVGQPLELTTDETDFQSNPCTFLGNGHNMIDPQDFTATPASSVEGKESAMTYIFAFDGTIFRCKS